MKVRRQYFPQNYSKWNTFHFIGEQINIPNWSYLEQPARNKGNERQGWLQKSGGTKEKKEGNASRGSDRVGVAGPADRTGYYVGIRARVTRAAMRRKIYDCITMRHHPIPPRRLSVSRCSHNKVSAHVHLVEENRHRIDEFREHYWPTRSVETGSHILARETTCAHTCFQCSRVQLASRVARHSVR